MDCVNHSGVTATAFCQNCGKALCAACTRTTATGQVLCEPCLMAWQSMQQPFTAAAAGAPSPVAAGVLGLIPGVGAMYNGQFFKGLIHVAIFAVLVSLTERFPLLGIFIGAWVLYQAFEAYHTAVARRDGLPLPDPLGLNEIGSWLTPGAHNRPPYPGASGAGPAAGPGGAAPFAGGYAPPAASTVPPEYPPYTQAGYPGYGDPPMPPVPPLPPVPPVHSRRKEPIFAVILVGFGLVLLLNQIGIVTERAFDFLWPLALIGFGGWLIVRRMGDVKGGGQ